LNIHEHVDILRSDIQPLTLNQTTTIKFTQKIFALSSISRNLVLDDNTSTQFSRMLTSISSSIPAYQPKQNIIYVTSYLII